MILAVFPLIPEAAPHQQVKLVVRWQIRLVMPVLPLVALRANVPEPIFVLEALGFLIARMEVQIVVKQM